MSVASGNWGTAGTWSPAGIPGAGDNLTISSGHVVIVAANGQCSSLAVNGTMEWSGNRTINAGSNLTINNGGVINGPGSTGTLNVAGTLTIPAGASATIGRVDIVITGATSVSGSLLFNNVNGSKSFSDVTISSGGTWNCTVSEAFAISGTLTNNGTFTANTGVYTLSGAAKTLGGSGSLIFNSIAVSGTYTNTATTQVNVNIAATGGLTQGANATLIIGDPTPTGNLTATASGNTVRYLVSTGNQSIYVTTYQNMVFDNTGTGNIDGTGTYTVNGNIDVLSGITSLSSVTLNGTLTVYAGATLSIGNATPVINGATIVDGTLNISSTAGTKTFTDITVSATGTWSASVNEAITINGNISNSGTFTAANGVYTLAGTGKTVSGTLSIPNTTVSGTYTNNGTFTVGAALSGTGTLTQGASSTLNIGGTSAISNLNATTNTPNTVNYNGATAQTIKAITYYNLQVSKTGGSTGTFGGSTTVNNDFTVTSGVASLGANNITVMGATSVSGTFIHTSATGTKTFGDVTVNTGGIWNAAAAISPTINGNLSNSGTFTANSGTYTLAGSGKTISGTLTVPTISVTGSYTNNGTFSSTTALGGAGTFAQGAAGTLNAGEVTIAVTTFNASASGNTVNYNLAGAQNVRAPTDGGYHHLFISGSGNKTLQGATAVNGNLTISAGTLVANNFDISLGGDWSNSGIFTPGVNTVTLNGSGAQSISKTGGETFNHLYIAGTGTKSLGSDITTNGNLTISSTLDVSASNYAVAIKGNWTNNGIFTQNSGMVTFNGTSAQTIGGSATTSFYNLAQSNAAGVSLAQHQNLYGVLTVSSGTFTSTGYNFALKSDASGTASIGAIPGGANFAGNIIMERYTGTGPTDWRFLSSAVSGATLADWSDDFAMSGFTGVYDPTNSQNFISVYSYDETQAGDLNLFGYSPATNVTNSISNGKGYWVYLGPTPVTFEVTGPPNKFSQSPTVTYTNSGDINNDGWNLITNPYPSALDWDNASWTKANLDNAIYIYNSYTGSYAAYVGGVGVNGGSRYVPSQQAFWVKANAASPVVTAVENVKASANPSYLRAVASPNTSHYPMAFQDFPVPLNTNTTPNSVRLTAKGQGYEDETFIRFMPGATSAFDPEHDAWKMNSMLNLSSVLDDTSDFSISSLPDLTSDITIKLRLSVPATGTYTIRRDSLLMLPMSSCILLEDLLTGNITDLRSNVSYSFTVSDTTWAPRFLLHVSAPVAKKALHPVCAEDSSGVAIARGTGTGPWDYVWSNANGDTLRTAFNSSSPDTLFYLPTGIYTVEVSGSACGKVKDTIRIQSTSTLAVMLSYADVSCYGRSDGSAFITVSGGVAPFTFLWSNGATSSAVNGLSAGNYSVTAIDSEGCLQAEFAVISQPALITSAFTPAMDTLNLYNSNTMPFLNSSSGASTFYWDFGDTTLPDTSRDPSHYYSYPGNYKVMLIASDGNCSDTSYRTMVVIYLDTSSTLSVKSLSVNHQVNVFYSTGEIHLHFDLLQPGRANIGMYNMLGENIRSWELKGIAKENLSFPVPDLMSGVYFITIEMPDAIISKKIIITKY